MWANRIIRVLITKERARPQPMSMDTDESGKPRWRPREGEKASNEIFIAIGLERYLVSQGSTIEEARRELENLLVVQEILDSNPASAGVKAAPEDYQRVRDKGDYIIHSNKFWAERCGVMPIIARFDIDMSTLKFTLTKADGTVKPSSECDWRDLTWSENKEFPE